MGRKERESMQKMAEIAKEGFILKLELIREAKRGIEDKKVGTHLDTGCIWNLLLRNKY